MMSGKVKLLAVVVVVVQCSSRFDSQDSPVGTEGVGSDGSVKANGVSVNKSRRALTSSKNRRDPSTKAGTAMNNKNGRDPSRKASTVMNKHVDLLSTRLKNKLVFRDQMERKELEASLLDFKKKTDNYCPLVGHCGIFGCPHEFNTESLDYRPITVVKHIVPIFQVMNMFYDLLRKIEDFDYVIDDIERRVNLFLLKEDHELNFPRILQLHDNEMLQPKFDDIKKINENVQAWKTENAEVAADMREKLDKFEEFAKMKIRPLLFNLLSQLLPPFCRSDKPDPLVRQFPFRYCKNKSPYSEFYFDSPYTRRAMDKNAFDKFAAGMPVRMRGVNVIDHDALSGSAVIANLHEYRNLPQLQRQRDSQTRKTQGLCEISSLKELYKESDSFDNFYKRELEPLFQNTANAFINEKVDFYAILARELASWAWSHVSLRKYCASEWQLQADFKQRKVSLPTAEGRQLEIRRSHDLSQYDEFLFGKLPDDRNRCMDFRSAFTKHPQAPKDAHRVKHNHDNLFLALAEIGNIAFLSGSYIRPTVKTERDFIDQQKSSNLWQSLEDVEAEHRKINTHKGLFNEDLDETELELGWASLVSKNTGAAPQIKTSSTVMRGRMTHQTVNHVWQHPNAHVRISEMFPTSMHDGKTHVSKDGSAVVKSIQQITSFHQPTSQNGQGKRLSSKKAQGQGPGKKLPNIAPGLPSGPVHHLNGGAKLGSAAPVLNVVPMSLKNQ